MNSIQPGQTGRGGTGARRALSVTEFCETLGVSRSTVHKMVRAGKIPDTKVLGKRIISIDVAERLLQPKEAV